jgi:[ribosomal protein S18]-alanine N-acetyltransferase
MSDAAAMVRRGREADLAAVLELERASTTAPHWSLEVYAAILRSQDGHDAGDGLPGTTRRCLYAAERDREVVGFAVGVLQPGGVAELESVVVEASLRRAGIGRDLCAAVIDQCLASGAAEVVLEVRAGSHGAIALYHGLGFVQAGRRPQYYSDPAEDALMMRLKAQ